MVTDDRAAFESEDDNVIFLWVSVSIYYYRSIYHWIYFTKVGMYDSVLMEKTQNVDLFCNVLYSDNKLF